MVEHRLHPTGRSAILVLAALTLTACGAAPTETSVPTRNEIERGEYLVAVGGCNDCHTAGHFTRAENPSGPLAGSDLAIAVPGLGAFVGPNLTPDPETGLGRWSQAEIVTALKTGERPDGRVLAPVMPWPALSRLDDADLQAIAAYLRSLPPARNQVAGPFGPEVRTYPVASMQIVPPSADLPPPPTR